MWRLTVFLLLMALLLPARLTAGTDLTEHRWQEGELVSRKTITLDGGFRHRYVYRLRGGDTQYVVSAKEPLKLDLLVPVKFTAQRRHLLIVDSDGKECKVSMIRKNRRNFAWR